MLARDQHLFPAPNPSFSAAYASALPSAAQQIVFKIRDS